VAMSAQLRSRSPAPRRSAAAGRRPRTTGEDMIRLLVATRAIAAGFISR
jgi:hypothetical protein